MMNGEVWWIDFGLPFGSEPAKCRPAIVVQSDDFNKTEMNTTVVIPLTSNERLADFPGNVFLFPDETGLSKNSIAVIPQITVIDKIRKVEKISKLKESSMSEIKDGIKLLLNLE